jgi:hypothetical protein
MKRVPLVLLISVYIETQLIAFQAELDVQVDFVIDA